jgi:hypothetical protein
MKKALIGFFAIAALVALRPLSKRAGRKMSQHCAQMASKCKEMMSAQGGSCGKATETHERFDQEGPRFLDDREPVGTT